MRELIQRWGNEHVEMDGRRVLLPRFSEISRTEGVRGHGALLACGREGRSGLGWWILLWEGPFEEKEARALVGTVQSQPAYKAFRKVIVGPTFPVDVNARLILQQGRIRLWDLQILNRLLDLYGMPAAPAPGHSAPASGEITEMRMRVPVAPLQKLAGAEEVG